MLGKRGCGQRHSTVLLSQEPGQIQTHSTQPNPWRRVRGTQRNTPRRWRATLVLLGCYPYLYPCCSWEHFSTRMTCKANRSGDVISQPGRFSLQQAAHTHSHMRHLVAMLVFPQTHSLRASPAEVWMQSATWRGQTVFWIIELHCRALLPSSGTLHHIGQLSPRYYVSNSAILATWLV